MKGTVLVVLLALPRDGLAREQEICEREVQEKYCEAWYGGDYHTACRYCGLGQACPDGNISGRKISDPRIR